MSAASRCLIDGSQGAVHMPVDVQDIDCDWYVMTGHKLYGPSGIGVLYGKKDRSAMQPFQGGGEMIVDVTEDASPTMIRRTGSRPARRRSCRRSVWGLRWTTWMPSAARIAAHEAELGPTRMNSFRRINALRMIGNAPGKGAIVSFEMEGIHAHDVSMLIDRSGVAVRAGTHCAQPLLTSGSTHIDMPGLVRHV
jgi:cysteine desulfurase/selenocysteine lyase